MMLTLKEKVELYERILRDISRETTEQLEDYAKLYMPKSLQGDINYPYLYGFIRGSLQSKISLAALMLKQGRGTET